MVEATTVQRDASTAVERDIYVMMCSVAAVLELFDDEDQSGHKIVFALLFALLCWEKLHSCYFLSLFQGPSGADGTAGTKGQTVRL